MACSSSPVVKGILQRFLDWCNEPLLSAGPPTTREIIVRLQGEVQRAPTNPMLRLRLGRALLRAEREDLAVRELRVAGQLFLREHEGRKARSTYRMLLELRPGDERGLVGYEQAQAAIFSESDDTDPTPIPEGGLEVSVERPPILRNTVVRTANSDRRKFPRVPWFGAEVELVTAKSSIVTEVCDLSANGLMLEGVGSIPGKKDSVSLRIRVPGREIVGTGRGIVTWLGSAANLRSKLGVRLDDVDPETRAVMLEHIARVLGWGAADSTTSRFRIA